MLSTGLIGHLTHWGKRYRSINLGIIKVHWGSIRVVYAGINEIQWWNIKVQYIGLSLGTLVLSDFVSCHSNTSHTSHQLEIIILCIMNPIHMHHKLLKNAVSHFWKVSGLLAGIWGAIGSLGGKVWHLHMLRIQVWQSTHNSVNLAMETGNRFIALTDIVEKTMQQTIWTIYDWYNQSQSIISSARRKEKLESVKKHVLLW